MAESGVAADGEVLGVKVVGEGVAGSVVVGGDVVGERGWSSRGVDGRAGGSVQRGWTGEWRRSLGNDSAPHTVCLESGVGWSAVGRMQYKECARQQRTCRLNYYTSRPGVPPQRTTTECRCSHAMQGLSTLSRGQEGPRDTAKGESR